MALTPVITCHPHWASGPVCLAPGLGTGLAARSDGAPSRLIGGTTAASLPSPGAQTEPSGRWRLLRLGGLVSAGLIAASIVCPAKAAAEPAGSRLPQASPSLQGRSLAETPQKAADLALAAKSLSSLRLPAELRPVGTQSARPRPRPAEPASTLSLASPTNELRSADLPKAVRPSAPAGTVLSPSAVAEATLGGAALPEAAAAVSSTPQPQAPLAPAQSWPTLNGLLHVPPWLNLGLTVQGDGFINPAGGLVQARNWIQQSTFDFSASRGFGKDQSRWRELDHWRLNGALTYVNGVAGYGQRIGASFPLTALDSPTGFWITEASLERLGGAGAVDVKAGLFSLDPGFVQAPVLEAYLNTVFNDVLNLNQPGLPINPYVAPGVQLHWRPGGADPGQGGDRGAWGEWKYAAYFLNPSTNMAAVLGVDPNQPSFDGHLQVLQWHFDRLPGARRLREPIRLGQQSFSRLLPTPLLQVGGGYVADRSHRALLPMVFSSLTMAPELPIGLDNRLWLGLSGGDEAGGNPVTLFGSGGWLCQGLIKGRPFDVLALGFGHSSFNQQLLPALRPQALLEINYSYAINSSLSLQPVLQWIQAPAGVGTILALGLQWQLQF